MGNCIPRMGTTLSVSHRHRGEKGSHCWLDLGSPFLYGTRANVLTLTFSLSRISHTTACFAKFPITAFDSGATQRGKSYQEGEKVKLSQYMTLGLGELPLC